MENNGKINPSNSFDEKVEAIVKYTKEIVPVSDYEAGIIRGLVRSVGDPLPSTKALIEDKIDDFTKIKADMYYILLRIKDIRRDINIPHQNKYYTQFMLLTKQGRPSTESKVAEIYALNSDMRESRDKLSDIDNLLEFLENSLNLIDSKIRNLESRKYSL